MTLMKATGAERATLNATKELFSVNAPVAGGGAQDFRQRRRAFFEGEAAAGRSEEETMRRLAKLGLPFVSVGGGYCGGKRAIVKKDGTQELPPCLGQMQCNPNRCHQAVITQSHAHHWRRIYRQNKELAVNPSMVHAKEHLEAAVQEAAEVLDALELPTLETDDENKAK